jgi:hypothetical protein
MALPVLGVFLASIAGPIAKKVLAAVGIGVLTYGGLSLIGNQIRDAVLSAWGGVGGSTLQILSLGGVPESIGIILGAFAARIALTSISRLGRIAS